MLYQNVETYLNEEVRKPIKALLKGDAETRKDVMQVVDYLCDKYREMNGLALFYENHLENEKGLFREWLEYATEKEIYHSCDYDSLADPFEKE